MSHRHWGKTAEQKRVIEEWLARGHRVTIWAPGKVVHMRRVKHLTVIETQLTN